MSQRESECLSTHLGTVARALSSFAWRHDYLGPGTGWCMVTKSRQQNSAWVAAWVAAWLAGLDFSTYKMIPPSQRSRLLATSIFYNAHTRYICHGYDGQFFPYTVIPVYRSFRNFSCTPIRNNKGVRILKKIISGPSDDHLWE